MVRAAPEQVKKKKLTELDQRFEQLMKQPLARKATGTELLEYERLAREQAPRPRLSWKDFLKEVLESPAPKPEDRTIDTYVRAAVAAQRPMPVEKAPESAEALKSLVVTKKIPDEPKLTGGAVRATVDLAFMFESKKVDFRKWCGEEKVV